jgi:hypothetical protein
MKLLMRQVMNHDAFIKLYLNFKHQLRCLRCRSNLRNVKHCFFCLIDNVGEWVTVLKIEFSEKARKGNYPRKIIQRKLSEENTTL